MKNCDGSVFGFDIQNQAIEKTKKRIEKLKENKEINVKRSIQLFLDGHQNLDLHLSKSYIGQIDIVMFNLGYLPLRKSDKSIITIVKNKKKKIIL